MVTRRASSWGLKRRKQGLAGRQGGQPADGAWGTRLCPPLGTLELRQNLSEMGITVAGSGAYGRDCPQGCGLRLGQRHSSVLGKNPSLIKPQFGSKAVLSNRTFCDDGNVLDLHSSIWYISYMWY